MKQLPASVARPLIRLSYLLPAITGSVMLIWAIVPHMFFLFNGTPFENDHSLFSLMGNTWNECVAAMSGSAEASANALYFSYSMIAVTALSWIAIVGYAATAISSAICSCMAFAYPPTAKEANRAKRYLRFLCPNRILYVLSNLALLFPAFFPQILVSLYHSLFNYDMEVYYYAAPAWLIVLLCLLFNIAAFLLSLPDQARTHMDMFRLYKAK